MNKMPALLTAVVCFCLLIPDYCPKAETEEITLPEPRYKSQCSVEEALLRRRSIRDYKKVPLRLQEVSQLLWAAQGITAEWGGRTAPSACAVYPLELYFVVGDVNGLSVGVYRYIPEKHSIVKTLKGDKREQLMQAAYGQRWVLEAPINLVFTGNINKFIEWAKARGKEPDLEHFQMVTYMEAGHAAENVYLQAVALNLGTVILAAFSAPEVKKALQLKYQPLYIMPVGRLKDNSQSGK